MGWQAQGGRDSYRGTYVVSHFISGGHIFFKLENHFNCSGELSRVSSELLELLPGANGLSQGPELSHENNVTDLYIPETGGTGA